jgi:hypothetical protein
MPTPARYHALQWFHDHEVLGRDAVFTRKSPTTRMRRLMVREGQVERLPVGQLDHYQWRLTPQGREALGAKQKKRDKADAQRERPESRERSS